MPASIKKIREKIITLLRWSEKYTKTDMVYIASGNFWLLVGRGISIAFGVLLTLAFANLLAPATYGTYKYIISLTGFVTAFSLTGLSTGLVREVAQGREGLTRPLFWKSIIWSLPASVVTLGISIYYFHQGSLVLAFGLACIAFTTPLSNSYGLFKGLLQGKRDFKTLSIYGIPNGLIPIIFLLITLFLTKNIIIILFVYFISSLIAGGIVYMLALRRHHVGYSTENLQGAMSYGKHLSAVGFISQVAGQIDQLLLGYFMGPIQLAVYALASAPLREMRNITENIFPLALPKFSARTPEELRANLPKRIIQMCFLSALVALVYIVAAPFLFKIFFPKYLAAIGWSQLLALALLVQPKGLIDTMLIAQTKIKQRYIATLCTNGIEILLCITLIPFLGIAGAVIATLVSEFTGSVALAVILAYT